MLLMLLMTRMWVWLAKDWGDWDAPVDWKNVCFVLALLGAFGLVHVLLGVHTDPTCDPYGVPWLC